MKATRTYSDVTARSISAKTHEWLADLVNRFGDEDVSAAIISEAAAGTPMDRIIGKVRDRLAQAAARRCAANPTHLGTAELLAVVRGEELPPDGPWTWDTRELSSSEYDETVAWAARRHGS